MHRRNIERASNGRSLRAIFAATGMAVAVSACGDDDAPPPVTAPAPEIVRDAYGLNGGSCYRFRAGNLFANATIEGPNTSSIVGRTVYRWSFRLQSGGLPDEWFLETEQDGAVRLLRAVDGRTADERTTREYQDTDTPPLFYQLSQDRFGDIFLSDTTFVTEVTPVCNGAGCSDPVSLERHEWVVQDDEAMVVSPDAPGGEPGVRLLYLRTINGSMMPAEYALVPGKGFAQIRAFDGTLWQACNWRYCDEAGNCAGAASCEPADLACN